MYTLTQAYKLNRLWFKYSIKSTLLLRPFMCLCKFECSNFKFFFSFVRILILDWIFAAKYNLSFVSTFQTIQLPKTVDPPMIPCPNHCGKQYKHKFNLNRHIRYECGVDKQFRCSECNREFSQKSSLKSHLGLIHGKLLT